MSFQEDLDEFLDVEQGFACIATITPGFGKSYNIKGIFSNNYYEADIGASGIAGSNPVFECSGKDLVNVDYGDFIKVDSAYYRIIAIKPDTSGWTVLLLEKQD